MEHVIHEERRLRFFEKYLNSRDTILICSLGWVLARIFAAEGCGAVPSLARR